MRRETRRFTLRNGRGFARRAKQEPSIVVLAQSAINGPGSRRDASCLGRMPWSQRTRNLNHRWITPTALQ
jgi:hypothetical protein